MKNEIFDMSVLSIDDIIKELLKMYSGVINAGLSPKILPSVMLWGAPGIGKSQAVREVAKELQIETKKKVNVTDVRLLLFNPIDLRGIPTSNEDKTLAVWLKPKIFDMDESDDVINILFLDEISAAPQSVQAAAYQITLDRVIGEHKLPDNCIVIAAGNRVTDKSVAYKMPKALANRLCHFEAVGSFESWKKWAISNGINEKVIGFLSFREDYLNNFDASKDDLAFATPRSWEMVSNLLNYVDNDVTKMLPSISGCIGSGIAMEFEHYSRIYESLPDINSIFDGTFNGKLSNSPDELYALVSAMIAYAREHKEDLDRIGNSITFAESLPSDFTMLLIRSYIAIEKGYIEKLKKIPEFYKFIQKKGSILNGIN